MRRTGLQAGERGYLGSSWVKCACRGCFQMLRGPELDLGIIIAWQLDGWLCLQGVWYSEHRHLENGDLRKKGDLRRKRAGGPIRCVITHDDKGISQWWCWSSDRSHWLMWLGWELGVPTVLGLCPHGGLCVLGWSKCSFQFFRKMLQKTKSELLANPIDLGSAELIGLKLSTKLGILGKWRHLKVTARTVGVAGWGVSSF